MRKIGTAAGSILVSLVVYGVMLGAPSAGIAEVVSTSEALALENSGARQVVDTFLARQEVTAELTALGVDPEGARLRAEALSGEELEALAQRIEETPAGGDGVLTVLGVTFLVLLILELVGVTDIFKRF